MKVLILEDNEEIQAFLVQHLREPEVTVDRAQSCREAIHKFAESRYDWAILEHMLPDGPSTNLLRVIRTPTEHIVMLTGPDWKQADVESVQSLGVEEVFDRSVELEQLVRHVRRQWASENFADKPRRTG